MRISDWSSDVCSSDLGFSGLAPVPAQCAEPPAPWHLRGEVGALLRRSEHPDRACSATRLPLSRGSRPGPLAGPNPAWPHATPIPGVRPAAALRLTASGQNGALEGRRSEEPPSELQSLMRISAAVFCLKKKVFIQ